MMRPCSWGWCLVTLVACATAGLDVSTLPRLGADDRKLFDDGVDMVGDPDAMGGTWLAQWESELSQRLEQSDIIVLGAFHTVRTTVDLDHHATHRLIMKVERAFFGELDDDLTLSSHHDAIGHEAIGRHRDQLLNGKFVAFVRRFRGEHDQVELHFRLLPASDSLMRRLDEHFESERANIKRIRVTQPAQ